LALKNSHKLTKPYYYYLDNLDTNSIIFRNVKNFRKISKKKNLCAKKISKFILFVKIKNYLIIQKKREVLKLPRFYDCTFNFLGHSRTKIKIEFGQIQQFH